MIKTKKAQNITKPYVILLILAVVAAISGTFFMFGQDMASTPNNSLNDASLQYIYTQSGFPYDNRSASSSKDQFYTSGNNTQGSLKDFSIEFQFYREEASDMRGTFQRLYELPTFFISMFNIDLNEAWTYIIQIINGLVWAIIFIVIYRIIRGLF